MFMSASVRDRLPDFRSKLIYTEFGVLRFGVGVGASVPDGLHDFRSALICTKFWSERICTIFGVNGSTRFSQRTDVHNFRSRRIDRACMPIYFFLALLLGDGGMTVENKSRLAVGTAIYQVATKLFLGDEQKLSLV